MVEASLCLKCSTFECQECFRRRWAEVYYFNWGIRQTGKFVFILYPLFVVHSFTVVPVIAVMANASNNSSPMTEENPRAHRDSAWEEHNRDYGMREMGHGRTQRDCKRQEGQSSSISQGGDWHSQVTQQEEVLDSGVLEIGGSKRGGRGTQKRRRTENPQCTQCTGRGMTCTHRTSQTNNEMDNPNWLTLVHFT